VFDKQIGGTAGNRTLILSWLWAEGCKPCASFEFFAGNDPYEDASPTVHLLMKFIISNKTLLARLRLPELGVKIQLSPSQSRMQLALTSCVSLRHLFLANFCGCLSLELLVFCS